MSGREQPIIKLQINNIDVLTGLLADENGEVGLEIRSAIVQEFTKRHLKEIANDYATTEWYKLMRAELKDMVTASIKDRGDWRGHGRTYNENSELVRIVKDMVYAELSNQRKEVREKTGSVLTDLDRKIKAMEEKYEKFIGLLDNKMRGTINNWDVQHEEKIRQEFENFKEELRQIAASEVQKANAQFFGGLVNAANVPKD